VSLEVVAQLSRGDEYFIKQLVDLQVPCLGLMEDVADVVHQSLDGPNPPEGGRGRVRHVYLHRLGLRDLPIQRDL
jgi:hypothetical protein